MLSAPRLYKYIMKNKKARNIIIKKRVDFLQRRRYTVGMGNNGYGQLGDGTITDKLIPQRVMMSD